MFRLYIGHPQGKTLLQAVHKTRIVSSHNKLTHSNPSREANRFLASQETLRILCTPKVHYRIHKCRHLSLSWANQAVPEYHFRSEAFFVNSS